VPLPTTVRAFFEPRLGYNLSHVRVHMDPYAAEAVQARAFTFGQHIVFGQGQYVPDTSEGQRLLAHELAHVIQQGAMSHPAAIQRQPQPPGGSQAQGQPNSLMCQGRRDITATFRAFVADVPTLLAQAHGLSAGEKTRLSALANEVLHTEGSADIDNYTVVACTDIPGSLRGEAASAAIDEVAKELLLSTTTADLMATFRRTQDTDVLRRFLQTIAHEKRHVTLGSAVAVAPANLQPGYAPSEAEEAAYRVEEILATAEEIAVSRRFVGTSYKVPVEPTDDEPSVRKLQVQWQHVRYRVTAVELQRLQDVIIEQLRARYGFDNGCDNVITVGVVTAMEGGRWYLCDTDTGRIVTKIPAGLSLCVQNGRHRICGPGP
jgi:hypothetical protein